MIELEDRNPHPRLALIVRSYQSRRARLGASAIRIALPARPTVLVEFHFARTHLVELQRTGERYRSAQAVAVGPQTFRRVDLILSDCVDVFTVFFRPTGLYGLFGIPMNEMTNCSCEAGHLFGFAEARELHEKLSHAPDLRTRARIMDDALLARLGLRSPLQTSEVEFLLSRQHASIEDLAASVGRSTRQLRRLFQTQVGLSPKAYARILRFHAALDAKTAGPECSWTDIAHQFGWFDQAHFDKDFREFASAAPSTFVRSAAIPS